MSNVTWEKDPITNDLALTFHVPGDDTFELIKLLQDRLRHYVDWFRKVEHSNEPEIDEQLRKLGIDG